MIQSKTKRQEYGDHTCFAFAIHDCEQLMLKSNFCEELFRICSIKNLCSYLFRKYVIHTSEESCTEATLELPDFMKLDLEHAIELKKKLLSNVLELGLLYESKY